MSNPAEPLLPSKMGSEPLSNESMYLNWCDLERGVTGVQRLAHQPNNEGTGRAEVWHAVMLRDGRRYRRGGTVPFDPQWRSHGRHQGEGLVFEHFEDRAVVTYEDSHCRSALRFTPYHDPVDWSKVDADADDKADHDDLMFSGHVEAGGSVDGMIWLDGERIEVRGMGYRDHSWGGVRDMRQFRTTLWANGTVGPACTFGILWSALGTGQCVEGGYVVRDGKVTKVAGIDMTVGMDVDSVTMRRAKLTLRCTDRSEIEVVFKTPFDGALFQSGDWITSDSPTAITVDGKAGVGTVESAMNARGGLEWPRVNGLCSVDSFGMRS